MVCAVESAALKRKSLDQPIKDDVDAMRVPTAAEAERIAQQVRTQFGRTLANWASDALVLRHAGLHRFTWNCDTHAPHRRQAA